MINLRRPTQSELEVLETNLRLRAAKSRRTPKLVSLAEQGSGDVAIAWRNEALRLFYLCIRHGFDPLEIEHHVSALGGPAPEDDNFDWEKFSSEN